MLAGSSRITGGIAAGPNQFPWMVSVRSGSGDTMTTCGGSLLSTQWVLTSASCVHGVVTVTLGFGSVNILAPAQTQQSSAITIHPSYNPNNLNNNIALIHLATPVVLSAAVAVIRLPSLSQATNDFTGIPAQVSGWGQAVNNGPISNTLNFVNKSTITNLVCSNLFGPALVTNTLICASGATPTQNVCYGDAGSPLVISEGETNTQIGLVSFTSGRGCVFGDPSGYTRLAQFLPWVQSITSIVARP